MTPQHDHEEQIYQYLREFRKYGEMLDHDSFEETVAHAMGLDPESNEFREIQYEAESLINAELEAWIEERSHSPQGMHHEEFSESENAPEREPVKQKQSWRPEAEESAEEVQYISVDFADQEEEESPDDDLVLAGKQIDIQVYHIEQ